jgi:hypothetical protein
LAVVFLFLLNKLLVYALAHEFDQLKLQKLIFRPVVRIVVAADGMSVKKINGFSCVPKVQTIPNHFPALFNKFLYKLEVLLGFKSKYSLINPRKYDKFSEDIRKKFKNSYEIFSNILRSASSLVTLWKIYFLSPRTFRLINIFSN